MHHRCSLYRRMLSVMLFTLLFTFLPIFSYSNVKSDQVGPQLLKDFNANTQSSDPIGLFPFGEKLLFTPYYWGSDTEPWVTDGTKAGTSLLKNINASSHSYPAFDVSTNGWAYFSATSEVEGRELWRTDGTPENTMLVADIVPGSSGSNPQGMVALNGIIYFAAKTKADDLEYSVWRSDGTTSGTKPLTGPNLKSKDLGVFGSSVFFMLIGQDTSIVELWRTKPDGTGVERIAEVCSGWCEWNSESSIPDFTIVSNQLFFTIQGRLWRTDGSSAGTVFIKQFSIIDNPPAELTAAGNLLYFTAGEGQEGRKVWHSDGSLVGTEKIQEVSGGLPYSYPRSVTKVGSLIYFAANDAEHGSELWKVGDVNSTAQLVKDIVPGTGNGEIYNLVGIEDVLFFSATVGSGEGDLWRSQGTEETTQMVKDIYPGSQTAEVNQFRVWKGKLTFVANDYVHGRELWTSDGSEAGTNIMFDLNIRSAGSQFRGGTFFQGKFYFAEESSELGIGLWRTDGTRMGTEPVYLGVRPQSIDGYFLSKMKSKSPAELNHVLYFSGNDAEHGTELWRTDGTREGTYLVKEVITGPMSLEVQDPASADGFIWFAAYDNNTKSYQLWRSNGTESGTVYVMNVSMPDIAVLNGHGIIKDGTTLLRTTSDGNVIAFAYTNENYLDAGRMTDFLSVNGLLFFSYGYFSSSAPLFITDGQAVAEITEVGTGYPIVGTHDLMALGNILYFSGQIEARKWGLWKLDIGSTEASLIKEFDRPYRPDHLVDRNGQIIFRVTDGIAGGTLWITDGTSEGTRIVCPSCAFSVTDFSIAWQRWVYFTAIDSAHGEEIWQTDGTEKGTMLFRDINPGEGSSKPGYFNADEKLIAFTADDGEHGLEPWGFFRTFNHTVYLPAIRR